MAGESPFAGGSDFVPNGSAFVPNTQGLQQLNQALRAATERAREEVWKKLRRWGQEYKRRVQRVVPVRYGTLRQSFQVIEENDGNIMSVTLGTSIKSHDEARHAQQAKAEAKGKKAKTSTARGDVPYPVYLEFGTGRIAGGRVMEWEEGEPPIMDWPAKLADLGGFRGSPGRTARTRAKAEHFFRSLRGKKRSGKYERAVKIARRAFTPGQGEQMPFMRPVGYTIAPKVIEDCRKAIQKGFGGLDGKKF